MNQTTDELLSVSEKLTSSFRDPSGFVFKDSGNIHRLIKHTYQSHYDLLMNSGLYESLTSKNLLIPHAEGNHFHLKQEDYKIITPEQISFISYPYEWCFLQYKDAAITTLNVMLEALTCGMVLKDASVYNVQFHRGRCLFIDTLSFEKYNEGEPWVAYGQFCRHFLAPLALMHYVDLRLSSLMSNFIDGVPLDIASKLLPKRSWLNLSLLIHIHLHAKSQQKHAGNTKALEQVASRKLSKTSLVALIQTLKATIEEFGTKNQQTEWANYYSNTNYLDESFSQKEKLVDAYIQQASPKSVWDLGANNGHFSRIASSKGIPTVAFDIDYNAVNWNYQQVKKNKERFILPLVMDLTNPSAAIGFANAERHSFMQRGPTDLVMALALVHHLSISNNIPFDLLADFFAGICHHLIIEFVPKSDSQVKKLLATRKDVFPDYHIDCFRQVFSSCFTVVQEQPISGTDRTLFLLKKR